MEISEHDFATAAAQGERVRQGVFGSRSWMAAQLGQSGGKAVSDAKATAARENGRKGGRPRKHA